MKKKFWLAGIISFAIAVPLGIVAANAGPSGNHQSADPTAEQPSDQEIQAAIADSNAQAQAAFDAAAKQGYPGPSTEERHDYVLGPKVNDLTMQICDRVEQGTAGEDVSLTPFDCKAFKLLNTGKIDPGPYSTEELHAAVNNAEGR